MSRYWKQWIFAITLTAALYACTGLVFADTEILAAMPASSEHSTRMNSEEFTITMEEEDVVKGYHHGTAEGSTEIYVRMPFTRRSEIWLSITLPMITRGSNFSRISYDLLLEDKKPWYALIPGLWQVTV